MNAVELELMRLRLEAAAEEMGVVLQRTALSANIKERRDFSCALFDAAGRLIAQAAHVPVHLGSMPESVAAVLSSLPPLAEGQTAIVNDPYAGGTHLPDITLVSPVFFNGGRIGYAANRAHHADVGGTTPGSMTLSRHIDEEGVRIPPSLLDEATLSKLLSAVRTPEERRGDLQAQELSNAGGAAALRRIAVAEGIEGLEAGFAALLAYAQRMTREVLAKVPPGNRCHRLGNRDPVEADYRRRADPRGFQRERCAGGGMHQLPGGGDAVDGVLRGRMPAARVRA